MNHLLEPLLAQLDALHAELTTPLFLEDDARLPPEVRWQSLTYRTFPQLAAEIRRQFIIMHALASWDRDDSTPSCL